MAQVVTGGCIGTKDRACVAACPVEAFYEGRDQLYIEPNTCICCAACEPVCPVNAIFAEDSVPVDQSTFVEKNARVFTDQHQAGCGCGYCDAETNSAIGPLPIAQPK